MNTAAKITTRVTALPYFGRSLMLDWGVLPLGYRAAQKLAASVGGFCVVLGTGRFVLRPVAKETGCPFKRFQVWGARGTYAQGVA